MRMLSQLPSAAKKLEIKAKAIRYEPRLLCPNNRCHFTCRSPEIMNQHVKQCIIEKPVERVKKNWTPPWSKK